MHGPDHAIVTIPYPMSSTANSPTLELDMALSCPGHADADCPTWDHTIQLYACCYPTAGQASADTTCPVELGRWISPFRRRIGRWLTDVSSLKPLLNDSFCTFRLTTAPWAEPWVVSLNLRFTASEQAVATLVHPLFEGGTFNASYNDRPTIQVALATPNPSKVVLEAVITGHGSDNNGETSCHHQLQPPSLALLIGCGEFCPTSHHFVVNGDEYMVNFTEAGTPFGCADKARLGAEPNEVGWRAMGVRHLC